MGTQSFNVIDDTPALDNPVVLMFDRDMTVDVNFDQHEAHMLGAPEDARGVPLSWVKWFAHANRNVNIDTWSHGNQHLRTEAEIPGIREARELWESYNERSVKPVYESVGYHNYKPARRDGLRLIKDVYNAYAVEGVEPDFIVADDADLRDMADEGITHLFPWNFVDAIENDELHSSLSMVEDVPYTGTSAESEACDEDISKSYGVLDALEAVNRGDS